LEGRSATQSLSWRRRKGQSTRSTTTNHAKAQQARSLGFDEVIDLSVEKLGDGVRRITDGYGADIVIDAIGGEILGEALGTLAMGGNLTTLGYAAGRKATIDVTDLIWKRASMKSFSVRTTCGGVDDRMERHCSVTPFRCGQGHRGKDVPAARSSGCSPLPG
jgi:NADPH:quinone reductase-like Zn-dependent oxidoreductase